MAQSAPVPSSGSRRAAGLMPRHGCLRGGRGSAKLMLGGSRSYRTGGRGGRATLVCRGFLGVQNGCRIWGGEGSGWMNGEGRG